MSTYDFTLRFDDETHSLSVENGIPINKLSELLMSLSKIILLQKDDKLILSEVRGNCYALKFTTNNEVVQKSLIVVHNKISKNDYFGLNANQRSYARKIKDITGDKYTLQAYNKDKSFKVNLEKIELPKPPDYYYQVSSVSGIITSIGGKSLKGKSTIHVSNNSYDIEINKTQEKKLAKYFKNKKIRFVINKKISVEDNEVKSAILEHFEILKDESFIDIISEIRSKYSNDIVEEYRNKYFKE